jgi:imidazolonepropionase-like amidohydrolase
MRSMIIVAAVLSSVAAPRLVSAESLLISAEKIYTAPESKALLNGSILIRAGRIAGVADDRSRLAIPKGTRTSECRGVVAAGFHNNHVHFMEPVWNDAAHARVEPLSQGLESMLTKYGFTTVVDTGSDQENTVALRRRIESGEIRGPRIRTAGLAFFPVDGLPFYVRDVPGETLAKMHQPRTADEARAQVRRNLDNGADITKLFLVTSPDGKSLKSIPLDIARAAVDETHAHGRLVFAHPTNIEGLHTAIAAGVDVLVHTTLDEQQPWDDASLQKMVAQRMSVEPTFQLWGSELRKQNVPQDVIDRLVAHTLEELQVFRAAGGNVLFGTDVGYMHEYDPTTEYELMAKSGMQVSDILASLTTAPAALWKDQNNGRVVPGQSADLVVLAGDPADDIRNFAKVRCVFRAGTLVYSAQSAGRITTPAESAAGPH